MFLLQRPDLGLPACPLRAAAADGSARQRIGRCGGLLWATPEVRPITVHPPTLGARCPVRAIAERGGAASARPWARRRPTVVPVLSSRRSSSPGSNPHRAL